MNAMLRLMGMLRSPRQTLAAAIERPRSLHLAALILLVCAGCSAAFLLTPVGRLAALDQHVRQLESIGTVVTDPVYADVRAWERYRPLISVVTILAGWPILWAAAAGIIYAVARRSPARQAAPAPAVTFAQVFTVLVHASSVFAVRAVVAAPINYVRESLGGATSLAMIVPGLGDATFVARLFGSIDIFALWWVALVAIGLGMLYNARAFSIGRWLVGAYAAGAAALAVTQALRGGV
jgi:hypothetical protein